MNENPPLAAEAFISCMSSDDCTMKQRKREGAGTVRSAVLKHLDRLVQGHVDTEFKKVCAVSPVIPVVAKLGCAFVWLKSEQSISIRWT